MSLCSCFLSNLCSRPFGWWVHSNKLRWGLYKKHVEVDIELEGTPEALDQGHCARLCGDFGVAGLVGQVRGNCVIDDA